MENNTENNQLSSSVTFTDQERDTKTPGEAILNEAQALFAEHGFIRLVNVFDPKTIDEWDKHYRRRYKSFLQSYDRGERPLFTVDVEGPFSDPYFFANPLIGMVTNKFLGDDHILAALSSVVSFPDAPDQFIHRDTEPIFGKNYSVDVCLPPYSITVLIPLVDCNLETGCTKVVPGSHRLPRYSPKSPFIDPEVRKGSVLITDGRLVHRGGANLSSRIRPLLYMTYHRKWFRDFGGYEERPPINVSNRVLKNIPREYRHMFDWTKDPYRLIRLKTFLRRILPVRFTKRTGTASN